MIKTPSVVTYALSQCVKCLKCVKACPTQALSRVKGRITVDQNRCINCGRCISTCHSKGIVAMGSTLDDIENYDYTVCMIPSALSSSCSSLQEVEELFYSIKNLGFDEVVDLSPYEGQIMKETQLINEEFGSYKVIASMCPVVNRLIETTYPMLLDNLTPLDFPSEVAAKCIRKRLADKGRVGIFNCCECEAKLALAKYPYGNFSYETDHALSIMYIFPKIQKHKGEGRIPVHLCREGLQVCNPYAMVQKEDTLIADGFEKVSNVLSLEEFGQLNIYSLLYLYPCFNGCIGGHLLFGNSFLKKNNIYKLLRQGSSEPAEIDSDLLYSETINKTSEDSRTFKEKVEFFAKVNEQLDKLPGYDCSACGLQTCRIMAEEIAKGNKKVDDCIIIRSKKEKSE